MKSFGLWYQKIKESDNEVETDHENIPQFSLHVNFWSLEDIKTKENINTPFLDIGIKIKNYKQLDHITFYCPLIFRVISVIHRIVTVIFRRIIAVIAASVVIVSI